MASNSKPTAAQLASKQANERLGEETLITESNIPAKTVISQKSIDKKKATPHKRGKKYVESSKKIKKFKNIAVSSSEALSLVRSISYAGFDETIELHINTDELGTRGEVAMPYSTGKAARVVIADDKVILDLEKGIIDFDTLLATPAMMAKLTKFAKILGPKGLMPNPKTGTISAQPEELMKKFSGNTLRYKTESKAPIIHLVIGKKSYPDDQLLANITAIISSINKRDIKSAYICSSMSPAVQIVV